MPNNTEQMDSHFAVYDALHGMKRLIDLVGDWGVGYKLTIQICDEIEAQAIKILQQVTEYRKKYLTRSGVAQNPKSDCKHYETTAKNVCVDCGVEVVVFA